MGPTQSPYILQLCMGPLYFWGVYSSVTSMLLELGLPRFNILMHNYKVSFANRLSACDNVLVQSCSPVLQCNL